MEKYSGLPDIDHDSRDIFETSDVESEVEFIPEEVKSEDIQTEELPTSARKRFTNDTIIGDINLVDFLGSLLNPVLGTRGYNVQQADENIDQKLARIARELEEIRLIQQTEAKGDPTHEKTTQLVDLLAGVESGTQYDLYTGKLDEILKQQYLEYPTTPEPIHGELANTLQVLELESRIDNLESLLGTDPIDLHTGANILTKLNDLKRRINIINNPEYAIDKIKKKVANLNEEAERVISTRRLYDVETATDLSDGFEDSSMVKDLFDRLPVFDNTNTIVPSVIRRLKSLNSVHSDMANCVSVVNSLDGLLKAMDQDISKWDSSINGLHSNIVEYEKNFEVNRKLMEEKIEDLTKKVDKTKMCT